MYVLFGGGGTITFCTVTFDAFFVPVHICRHVDSFKYYVVTLNIYTSKTIQRPAYIFRENNFQNFFI